MIYVLILFFLNIEGSLPILIDTQLAKMEEVTHLEMSIFLGNDDAQLLQAIKEIQDLGLNIKDQGHPADYVGISIKKHCDSFY
jgi:hypothetical protein